MRKHRLNPDNTLFDLDKSIKLKHFFQTVPFLTFSDKGLENIAKRFGLTLEELQARITEFEAREGRKDALR